MKGYDYSSAGWYYVTICAGNKEPLFGRIEKSNSLLNEYGTIVQKAWGDLANRYPHVSLDEHIVMPNHFHGIIIIGAQGEDGSRTAFTMIQPPKICAIRFLKERNRLI